MMTHICAQIMALCRALMMVMMVALIVAQIMTRMCARIMTGQPLDAQWPESAPGSWHRSWPPGGTDHERPLRPDDDPDVDTDVCQMWAHRPCRGLQEALGGPMAGCVPDVDPYLCSLHGGPTPGK